MFHKQLRMAVLGAGMLLGVATHAAADCRKQITLTSTGVEPDTSGTAEVRAVDTRQRLKVSMDSTAPDGTVYIVVVNRNRVVGTMTVQMGNGQLELTNNRGNADPLAVDPICTLSSVAVINGDLQPVLFGAF